MRERRKPLPGGPLGVANVPTATREPPLIDKIFWETKAAA